MRKIPRLAAAVLASGLTVAGPAQVCVPNGDGSQGPVNNIPLGAKGPMPASKMPQRWGGGSPLAKPVLQERFQP